MTLTDGHTLTDLENLLAFLEKLRSAHVHYELASHRSNAIMVLISVPGERWEVEFLTDGTVEVEKFRSDGNILGPEALDDLWAFD